MNLRKIINKQVFLLYLFSPFTVWFALSPYLRLNILLILILALSVLLFKKGLPPLKMPSNGTKESLCITILLALLMISFVVNSVINPQHKLLSNFLGLIIVLFVFYYLYNAIIYSYGEIQLIVKGCTYGCILLMFIVITDGVLANFGDIRIHDWFVWGYSGNTSYFERNFWTTPCSPCVEPAEASLFVNCLFPFCFITFKKRIERALLCLLFIFSQFTLFSSTGIFTALSGIILIAILFTKNKSIKIIIPALTISFALFIYIFASDYLESLAIIEKLTLSGETSSDASRQISWSQAIADGINSPLWGMGPGYGKSILEEGYLSTFLLILGDFGMIAFGVFIYYWYLIFNKVVKLHHDYRIYIMYSFYSISIGAMVGDMTNVFSLWILVPIIFKIDKDYKRYKFKRLHNENLTYRQPKERY